MKELIKTREEKERDLYGIGGTKFNSISAKNPFLGLCYVYINDLDEVVKILIMKFHLQYFKLYFLNLYLNLTNKNIPHA